MNLIEMLLIVWRGKWILVGITSLVVGLAVAYVMIAKDWYRADVLLKPMESKFDTDISSQSSVLGGLASFAGFGMGNNPSAEPIAVLTSRELTGAFIDELHLLPVLFPKMWDASHNQWKKEIENPPDVRDGIQYFSKKICSVAQEKKTGLVTLTVEWRDAKTAANWANLLVARVNDRMRQRALTQAESNVTYLKEQLASTSIVTMQQSIGRVLESELQKLLLARANNEFAFRIIDHAAVPKAPSRPQRVLIVAAAFFGGFGISVVFLLFRDVLRRHRVPSNGTTSLSAEL